MEVLINNCSAVELDLEFFRELAEEVLEFEKVDAQAELSIVFLDEDQIHELNAKYRGVDSSTDVLSFLQSDDNLDGPHLLGDVVISPQVAQAQARKYQHSFDREMAILLIHGILHLLGFDHQTSEEKKAMQEKEEKILKTLSFGEATQ